MGRRRPDPVVVEPTLEAGLHLSLVEKLKELEEVKALFKNPKSLTKAIEDLLQRNTDLEKALEVFKAKQVLEIKNELLKNIIHKNENITLNSKF